MPESLKQSELSQGQDPAVSKQWDNDVTLEEKYKDFGDIADKIKVCMMGTFRPGTGPLGRSMGVAKRVGPDFLFISNSNSEKMKDIKENPLIALSFQNTSNADWISITGEVTTVANDDPRIKEVYSSMMSAWFGDIGDGVHNGSASDPRMVLIEVKAKYISYWKHTVLGAIGFMTETVTAAATGTVAQTGKLRQLETSEIDRIRAISSNL